VKEGRKEGRKEVKEEGKGRKEGRKEEGGVFESCFFVLLFFVFEIL
jgi:hypothetical protein